MTIDFMVIKVGFYSETEWLATGQVDYGCCLGWGMRAASLLSVMSIMRSFSVSDNTAWCFDSSNAV